MEEKRAHVRVPLQIDVLREADLPAALALSTQAGWNQVEADWRRLLALWPGTCLAGRVNEELVATATVAVYGHLGWVGMMLVGERCRGQGYGTAMLDVALRAGVDAGARAFGLDATDLGRPLYLKRGFRDVGRIDRWVLEELGSATSPSTTRDTRRKQWRPRGREWDALLLVDRAAVDARRGKLLDRLVTEASAWATVLDRGAQALQGFALARAGRLYEHVGPVIAEERLAETVLDALIPLQTPEARRMTMDVPRGQLAGWLQARGWRLARELWRMHTAPDEHPTLLGPRVFAAAGFELG